MEHQNNQLQRIKKNSTQINNQNQIVPSVTKMHNTKPKIPPKSNPLLNLEVGSRNSKLNQNKKKIKEIRKMKVKN